MLRGLVVAIAAIERYSYNRYANYIDVKWSDIYNAIIYGRTASLRRHLHPALKQLGFINPFTGTHKAGHHAFRRFRNTHLRNRSGYPEGLRKFWLGHADESMCHLALLTSSIRASWSRPEPG